MNARAGIALKCKESVRIVLVFLRCVPFYGNVLPRLQLGSANNASFYRSSFLDSFILCFWNAGGSGRIQVIASQVYNLLLCCLDCQLCSCAVHLGCCLHQGSTSY